MPTIPMRIIKNVLYVVQQMCDKFRTCLYLSQANQREVGILCTAARIYELPIWTTLQIGITLDGLCNRQLVSAAVRYYFLLTIVVFG